MEYTDHALIDVLKRAKQDAFASLFPTLQTQYRNFLGMPTWIFDRLLERDM